MKKYIIIILLLLISNISFAANEIDAVLKLIGCPDLRKSLCDCAKNELERDNKKLINNFLLGFSKTKNEEEQDFIIKEFKSSLFGFCKWKTIDEVFNSETTNIGKSCAINPKTGKCE
jgi:hypothetical protein